MKKVISSILGIIFVIIVICGAFVATYIFSSPSHEVGTDSRELVLGYWTDEDADIRITLGQEGDFLMTKESDTDHIIAKGYFKISEEAGKIKVFILPGEKNRDKDYDLGEKLGFFSTITFRDLKVEDLPDGIDPTIGWSFLDQWQKDAYMAQKAEATFIVSGSDEVYKVSRTRTVEEFYDGKSD